MLPFQLADYTGLCGVKPGQIINPMTGLPEEIDECSLIPQICRAGICHNTATSYDCECFRGFVFDEGLHTCIGRDNSYLTIALVGNVF